MSPLNKWAAEACEGDTDNTRVTMTMNGWTLILNSDTFIEWDLADDSCMRVFREKFKISTKDRPDGVWLAVQYKWTKQKIGETYNCLSGQGKSIREAEMKCAIALFKNRERL